MASFTTSAMTSATPQSIAAAYSSSSSMVFVPGSLATIQNLKSENGKKLNGKIARVVNHTKGKVVVTVDNGKRFKVNSFNLIVVEPEKEPKNETQKDTKKNNKQNQRKKKNKLKLKHRPTFDLASLVVKTHLSVLTAQSLLQKLPLV